MPCTSDQRALSRLRHPRAGHAKDLVCATWHRQGALLHQSPGHLLLAHTSPSWLNRRLVCVDSEVCFPDLKGSIAIHHASANDADLLAV